MPVDFLEFGIIIKDNTNLIRKILILLSNYGEFIVVHDIVIDVQSQFGFRTLYSSEKKVLRIKSTQSE